MHRALGPAGGAGGVDEDREILRLHGGDARLERTGMRLRMHAAEFAQGHQVDHAGIGEIAQALHVHDDDLAQPRQHLAHLERLVELLLVLDEQHAGARVLAEVVRLRGRIGRVDAVADAAAGEDGEIGQHPLDARIGEDGGALARREAEAHQAVGDLAHRLAGLRPAPLPPQAEFLLAQEDLGPALRHAVPEQRRHRLARQHDLGAGLQRIELPQVRHALTSRSSSSSSAARRARRIPSCRDRTP